MTLGEKLKKLRLEKQMTLHDVAKATGYSKALISRIENDSVSPSIASLVKITSVLQIRLNDLFTAIEGGHISVVKKNERKSYGPGSGVTIEELCETGPGHKMNAAIKTLESGAQSEESSDDGGEEWWHILKGRLQIVVDEKVAELNEGDSIYVISESLRKWRNPAKGRTSVLVVKTAPAPAGNTEA
jgi:transcriptional regulator with XRE-family HTH domain